MPCSELGRVDELSERAYELWENAGSPEGQEQKYWDLAEQEMRTTASQSNVRVKVSG